MDKVLEDLREQWELGGSTRVSRTLIGPQLDHVSERKY